MEDQILKKMVLLGGIHGKTSMAALGEKRGAWVLMTTERTEQPVYPGNWSHTASSAGWSNITGALAVVSEGDTGHPTEAGRAAACLPELTEDSPPYPPPAVPSATSGLGCERADTSISGSLVRSLQFSFAAASPLLCSGSIEKKYFLPCAPKPSF